MKKIDEWEHEDIENIVRDLRDSGDGIFKILDNFQDDRNKMVLILACFERLFFELNNDICHEALIEATENMIIRLSDYLNHNRN